MAEPKRDSFCALIQSSCLCPRVITETERGTESTTLEKAEETMTEVAMPLFSQDGEGRPGGEREPWQWKDCRAGALLPGTDVDQLGVRGTRGPWEGGAGADKGTGPMRHSFSTWAEEARFSLRGGVCRVHQVPSRTMTAKERPPQTQTRVKF